MTKFTGLKNMEWWKEDVISPAFEVVLLSGRFARIERITALDFLEAVADPNIPFILILCCLCCTIDEKKLHFREWADMEIDEAYPVLCYLHKRMEVLRKSRSGVS